jgi:hypothetical protein
VTATAPACRRNLTGVALRRSIWRPSQARHYQEQSRAQGPSGSFPMLSSGISTTFHGRVDRHLLHLTAGEIERPRGAAVPESWVERREIAEAEESDDVPAHPTWFPVPDARDAPVHDLPKPVGSAVDHHSTHSTVEMGEHGRMRTTPRVRTSIRLGSQETSTSFPPGPFKSIGICLANS